jgi:rRNA maturation endonuclease Nob1
LGRYDFRCFGCGGVIHSTEDACSICGWSWK